jgi:hypothetical protein
MVAALCTEDAPAGNAGGRFSRPGWRGAKASVLPISSIGYRMTGARRDATRPLPIVLRSVNVARSRNVNESNAINPERQGTTIMDYSCLAEGVGFEPTVRFHAHTLSKRAP